MRRLAVVGVATLVTIWMVRVECARASEFTDAAEAAKSVLESHLQGKPGAIVVGLIDEQESQVVGVGTLDDGTSRQVDGDTLFFIGSVTKTFTDLVLADMVARSEVKLDDPVQKYLPADVRVPSRGGREITLLDLATHTAGLPTNPSNMTGADVREQYETYSVEKMYAFLNSFELKRDPGTVYEYSNVGMALLGHALARKTAMSYEALVTERVCKPLEMTDTCVVPTGELKDRLARGRDEKGEPTWPWQLDVYQPAGSVHSTANDLLKYAAAQAGITLSELTPAIEATHEIRLHGALGPPDGSGGDRFFGNTAMPWMDRTALQPDGMQLLGHAGGAGSYHAWVGFDMQQHRGVVVASTANDVQVEAIGWTLLQRLPLSEDRLHDFAHDFVGIGTVLEQTKDDRDLRITKVLPDSPAADAGLTAGLIIQTVDDTATRGKTLAECIGLLRGPAGAKVRLEIFDPAQQNSRVVELTRRKFRT